MLAEGINLSFFLPLCWSVKESAYKVIVKSGKNVAFSPGMFSVNIVDIQCFVNKKKNVDEVLFIPEIKVNAYGLNIFSFSEMGRDYIHTIASLQNDGYTKIKRKACRINSVDNQREEAYNLLIKAISEETGINSEALSIMKNERNIPVLAQKSLPLNIDISISHDGNFVSYAFYGK